MSKVRCVIPSPKKIDPYYERIIDLYKKKTEKLGVKNGELLIEIKGLKGLLGVAICPNAVNGCKDGVYYNARAESEQCQWCSMTKQALKNETNMNPAAANSREAERRADCL